MRSSCLLSYTDHVPLEAINKELSRHESNSQQAIIMELSCEESCCSAGNNQAAEQDRKSTRLNSSHQKISYAVFCLKKKKEKGGGGTGETMRKRIEDVKGLGIGV